MQSRIIDDISRLPERSWNSLATAQCPFLDHRFLAALEASGCVNAESGWHPQHLALFDEDEQLIAAAPLYLKNHSYGEYVFDWAWARACEDAGIDYYPKLVSAVPMTPVAGPRLLVHADAAYDQTATALSAAMLEHARKLGVSSLHWLFTDERDTRLLHNHALLERHGIQYQWENRGYESFDHYLSSMPSAKRKKIKRERRRVAQQGVSLRVLHFDIPQSSWDHFYRCYCATISGHGALRYLNREFFLMLGESMSQHTVMVLAEVEGRPVAAALCLQGGGVLYGRYWGWLQWLPDLHFEVCYYQAIEYCITHGLHRFEAGAQGEHKLARGLAPVLTRSMHWISHPGLRAAVDNFLAAEQQQMGEVRQYLEERLPFKK